MSVMCISQETYIIWLLFVVEMCKVIISLGVFFNVKILIFQIVKGLKGQIMGQNEENFCLLNQEPCIIWYDLHLWYTCMYKRIISPGIFFFFSKFWFLGSLGLEGVLVKGQKIAQYDKELCLSHSVSQEPYIIYCDFWYMCVKWWYIQQIVSFFKILILGFLEG